MIAEEMERGTEAGLLALRQVAKTIGKAMKGTARFEPGGKSFRCQPGISSAAGLLESRGRLEGGGIVLDFVVAEVPEDVLVQGSLFRDLGEVAEGIRLGVEKSESLPGVSRIVSRMRLAGDPMGPAAETAFSSKLASLGDAASRIRGKIPESVRDTDLEGKWAALGEAVSVVRPMMGVPDARDLLDWLRVNSNYLLSGCNVALAAESSTESGLALDFLASWGKRLDISLAEINAGQITPDQVAALASKAPGCLVVPAIRLGMGTNLYSLAKEASSMLTSLRNHAQPVVFTGTMSDLQSVFSGGQGGTSDPLNPVLARVPEASLPTEVLVRFALKKYARRQGGIAPKDEDALCEEITGALGGLAERDRIRVLPMAASRTLRLSRLRLSSKATPLKAAVADLANTRESFGGLETSLKRGRCAAIQRKILSVLTDPDLKARLNRRIVGQRKAIDEIVDKLKSDILMGRSDRPLVAMAVGPSGTGKSFACKTLAEELAVPHVWFNAGQYGSIHTVDSILNGVPLGYVGSYKKGKKERCAGNPDGALLEVSDLDHASSQVRHYLSDSFLEDIDTGRSQTASGAEFSTAGILFFFTVNLPYGLDEKLTQRTGFGPSPETDEVGLKANEELKKLFSNAFLARVGQAAVFKPLDDADCAAIVERAVCEAVENAVRNLEIAAGNIVLVPGLGKGLLNKARLMKSSMGARALVKYARSRVADAVLRLEPEACRKAEWHVSATPAGGVRISLKNPSRKEAIE